MSSSHNDWEIDYPNDSVEINGECYSIGIAADESMALCHSLLLLVDAVKDLAADVRDIRHVLRENR